MTPIQQLYLGLGAEKKTYLDDVFSNYLWTGDGASTRTITNGIDLSGEGGLTWIKHRDATQDHVLVDTVRGATKKLHTNKNNGQATDGSSLKSFTSTGFTIGSQNEVNQSSNDYVSWSFRRNKGFFDIVTYNGSSSAQNISHSLGCVPGTIIVKKTSGSDSWAVWHRSFDNTARGNLALNSNSAVGNDSTIWNDTAPTASVFSVGQNGVVNESGATYVAYLFAGGESPADTAKSVKFAESGGLSTATSTDLVLGTGDFTAECWFKINGGNTDRIISMDKTSNPTNKWLLYHHNGTLRLNINGTDVAFSTVHHKQWYHVAIVKASNVTKMYVNGQVRPATGSFTYSDTKDYQSDQLHIGQNPSGSEEFNGWISNVRVVAGTAVYTTSFIPPTEPLKNITNTKILCCNDSSTTGKTVGPSLTGSGSIAASNYSPFDDPAGFKFGDSKEGIVKCGMYEGTGNAGVLVDIGWEPQYLMYKNTEQADDWFLIDSMRGIVTGDGDHRMRPNTDAADNTSQNNIALTSTGFKLTSSDSNTNGNTHSFVYIAIRRPDSYVGKPAEVGTDVFAMDEGNSSYPSFTSNFPVDFGILRREATSENWYGGSRSFGAHNLRLNDNGQESNDSNMTWDSNVGWYGGGGANKASSYQSWMWKRGAGFDVVLTDPGLGGGHNVRHSLGRKPEMIWAKKRATSNWSGNADGGEYPLDNWWVWHQNSGTSNEYSQAGWLNKTNARGQYTMLNGNNAVHATHVEFASNVTYADDENFMLFFASVAGISKCGAYSGSGSSGNAQNIGFQPRFLMVKRVDTTGAWYVFDSLRTTSAPFDRQLEFNTTNAQDTVDKITVSSTGWSFTDLNINESGSTYIYYAHA